MFILTFSDGGKPGVGSMTRREEIDFSTPQREAAMFYGLFLRGHSVEKLRRDIDVPKAVAKKWLTARHYEPSFRSALRRVYTYRKMVLAIFDELVLNERSKARPQ
jgi:hypothetical protein